MWFEILNAESHLSHFHEKVSIKLHYICVYVFHYKTLMASYNKVELFSFYDCLYAFWHGICIDIFNCKWVPSSQKPKQDTLWYFINMEIVIMASANGKQKSKLPKFFQILYVAGGSSRIKARIMGSSLNYIVMHWEYWWKIWNILCLIQHNTYYESNRLL